MPHSFQQVDSVNTLPPSEYRVHNGCVIFTLTTAAMMQFGCLAALLICAVCHGRSTRNSDTLVGVRIHTAAAG